MKFISKLISPLIWKERIERWKRTIEVSKKPDKDEFYKEAKVAILGIGIIGVIGFVIFLIYTLTIGGLIG